MAPGEMRNYPVGVCIKKNGDRLWLWESVRRAWARHSRSVWSARATAAADATVCVAAQLGPVDCVSNSLWRRAPNPGNICETPAVAEFTNARAIPTTLPPESPQFLQSVWPPGAVPPAARAGCVISVRESAPCLPFGGLRSYQIIKVLTPRVVLLSSIYGRFTCRMLGV